MPSPQLRRMRGITLAAIIAAFIIALAVTGALAWFNASLMPRDGGGSMVFTVSPGQGAASISERLEAEGLIRSALAFRILARRQGLASSLQAGTYRLNPRQGARGILAMLAEGRVGDTRVTVPEGLTSRRIADILVDKGILPNGREFLAIVDGQSLEGRLFPETYSIPLGTKPSGVIEIMTDRFAKAVSGALGPKALDSPGFGDTLILASIIEREAAVEADRPLVASVFANRLRVGKRLESCATIQYILGKPKARLLYADLRIDSPFNTYIHGGLPPAPICNPGLGAIKAAAAPADTDYMYFVLGKDGRHVFSRDYASHLRAQRKTSVK